MLGLLSLCSFVHPLSTRSLILRASRLPSLSSSSSPRLPNGTEKSFSRVYLLFHVEVVISSISRSSANHGLSSLPASYDKKSPVRCGRILRRRTFSHWPTLHHPGSSCYPRSICRRYSTSSNSSQARNHANSGSLILELGKYCPSRGSLSQVFVWERCRWRKPRDALRHSTNRNRRN